MVRHVLAHEAGDEVIAVVVARAQVQRERVANLFAGGFQQLGLELGQEFVVRALVGDKVLKSERCCGESGTLGVTRPDISTQVRFRKEEEIRKGEAQLRASGAVGAQDNIKILTSCPSCLQGITRYGDDLQTGLLEADYIVIEMAKQILGENWLPEYVQRANNGGIERVLV